MSKFVEAEMTFEVTLMFTATDDYHYSRNPMGGISNETLHCVRVEDREFPTLEEAMEYLKSVKPDGDDYYDPFY